MSLPDNPSPRRRGTLIAAAGTFGVLLVCFGVIAASFSANDTAPGTTDPSKPTTTPSSVSSAPAPSAPSSATPTEASVVRGYMAGDVTAPVKVRVWSDLNCPHCANFEGTYGDILLSAAEAGTAQVEYMIAAFLDETSVTAGAALGCAADQMAFLKAYQHAFKTQEAGFETDTVLGWAEALDLPDKDTFKQCVQNGQYENYVAATTNHMAENEIFETPAIQVDGERINISGMSRDEFAQMLGLELTAQ